MAACSEHKACVARGVGILLMKSYAGMDATTHWFSRMTGSSASMKPNIEAKVRIIKALPEVFWGGKVSTSDVV